MRDPGEPFCLMYHAPTFHLPHKSTSEEPSRLQSIPLRQTSRKRFYMNQHLGDFGNVFSDDIFDPMRDVMRVLHCHGLIYVDMHIDQIAKTRLPSEDFFNCQDSLALDSQGCYLLLQLFRRRRVHQLIDGWFE